MVWMFRPVERSMTVSAPQRIAQTSLSTSSAVEKVTAELPMLALIFTRKFRPMIIGSDSGGFHLSRLMACHAATTSLTDNGDKVTGQRQPQDNPYAYRVHTPC